MGRARLLLLALGAACALPPPAAVAPAPPGCLADLDSTVALVARDYAGLAGRPLPEPTEGARAAAAAEPGEQACTAAIRRWVDSFRDPHLTVYGRAAPGERPESGPPRGGRGPSLRFPDDGGAVLRLPSFDLGRRAAIDSLLAEHRERLLATPVLLVDVRGNGGGWSGSYRGVLPLLYTGPIRVRGIEIWASEGNIAAMRGDLAIPALAPEVAAQIREVLPRMERGRGGFVTLQDDGEIRLDTVHPLPRAVGVLIDRGCASACEQFVLEARQSAKVTVFGAESTRGALDYLNVRTVPLPSGLRTLRLPISRLRGLPADPVNPAGLAPEVIVPAGEDPVDFALRVLGDSPTGTSPSAPRPSGTAR